MAGTDVATVDDDGARAEATLASLDGVLRRPHLTLAGQGDGGRESLLVTGHVLDLVGRTDRYLNDTGVHPDDVYTSPTVSIPLPFYDGGTGRFTATAHTPSASSQKTASCRVSASVLVW